MSRSFRDLDGADPYQLLGVTTNATPRELTEAYKRRMREAHPDLSPGDQRAERVAKLLNVARDVLLDADLRRGYDEWVARGADPDEEIVDDTPPTSAWDADDVATGWSPPPTAPFPYSAPPYSGMPYTGPPYRRPVHPAPKFYPYRPPRQASGLSLGIWALIAAALCGPAGLVLGIVALSRRPPRGSADQICAIVAVSWSVLGLVCCAGWLIFNTVIAVSPQ